MSEQTSAAQSAPAGEREAFDKWFRAEQLIADHIDTTFISSAFLPYKAFQAGASWQRTQSAGVPEGWRLVPEVPNEAIRDAIDLLCDDASAFDDSEAFWHYLLAAAPAQPAPKPVKRQTTANPTQQGEAVEVVAYRVSLPSEPELGQWFDEHAEGEPQMCQHEPLMAVAQHQRILAAASVPAGCKVVPVELLERLEHVTRTLVPHLQCHVDLRALLASVEGGE